MKDFICGALAVLVGFASYLLGGFDLLLNAFAIIVILDTLSGMLKAWNDGNYESKKFRSGFIKKISYFIGVLLTVQIDRVIGNSGVLRDAVLTLFIANEGFSIIENLGAMGVKFPEVLTNAIKSLGENKQK